MKEKPTLENLIKELEIAHSVIAELRLENKSLRNQHKQFL